MSKLKNEAPNQIIRIIRLREIVRNNQKTDFHDAFSHFGSIWAPPNGPKWVPEDSQVGGMYGSMSELRNKPLTKLFVCRIKRYGSEHCRKTCFSKLFSHFWAQMNDYCGP
jgi:hypothetical protein